MSIEAKREGADSLYLELTTALYDYWEPNSNSLEEKVGISHWIIAPALLSNIWYILSSFLCSSSNLLMLMLFLDYVFKSVHLNSIVFLIAFITILFVWVMCWNVLFFCSKSCLLWIPSLAFLGSLLFFRNRSLVLGSDLCILQKLGAFYLKATFEELFCFLLYNTNKQRSR